MKIIQVVDKLNVGGAERVLVDMTNILYEHGEDVSVISLLDKGVLSHEILPQIPQVELKRRNKYSLKTIYKFIQIAKHADIIHVHMRHNLRYVAFCCCFSPSLRRHLVFHDHYGGIEIDTECSFIEKIILRHFVRYYIGVSQKLTLWAQQNGTRLSCILSNIVRKQKIEKLYLKSDECISVGNFRKMKNYEFLVSLSKSMPDQLFNIYGNDVDHAYAEKIKKSKFNNLNIIHGISNIQPLLANYALALHVAKSETGPLVLIEYLAQGLPFLTYRTGEVVSQIANDLPEFVIDNFDINEWISRIKLLKLRMAEDHGRLEKKIQKVYEKYYSEEKYYQKCVKIYHEVVDC